MILTEIWFSLLVTVISMPVRLLLVMILLVGVLMLMAYLGYWKMQVIEI